MSNPGSRGKLGIIAGGGVLPRLLAQTCKSAGRSYYVLGLSGFADTDALGQDPDGWLRLGEAASAFERLRAADVKTVVMAGAVRRPTFADLKPDFQTAALFTKLVARAVGDDSLLRALIGEFEEQGFTVVGADDILGELLARPGCLGRHKPDAQAEADIAVGIKAARELGRADVGQAVVVEAGRILGREDTDGTEALIARSAGLKHNPTGGVLVKMKKPQQDRRADLPAIGPDTVTQAAAAGLGGIAVEAGGSLILGVDAVVKAADDLGLFVIGVGGHE